ncbi:hypothetical protein APPUASWS_018445 [Arthrospira platensis str. Paraca]|nr:hypothetical protein APPUASWS_018445 [Arthrospira platensis str. Paraca]
MQAQFQSRPFQDANFAPPDQEVASPEMQFQQESSGFDLANIPVFANTKRSPEPIQRTEDDDIQMKGEPNAPMQRVFQTLAQRDNPTNGTPQQPIQAKLTVGAVGDKYEQEADRVADVVVDQIQSPPTHPEVQKQEAEGGQEQPQLLRTPRISQLQKKEELSNTLQRESDEEEFDDDGDVQMKPQTASAGGEVSADLESSIQREKGGGEPLDEHLQSQMGQAMGADFRGVRIHDNSQASQLNQSIQAKAFTTGQDIFFKQGEYQPESRGGQKLIAHELTHVVQQGSGPGVRKINRQNSPQFFPVGRVSEAKIQREGEDPKQIQEAAERYVSKNMPTIDGDKLPSRTEVQTSINVGQEAGGELEKLLSKNPELSQVVTELYQKESAAEEAPPKQSKFEIVSQEAKAQLPKNSDLVPKQQEQANQKIQDVGSKNKRTKIEGAAYTAGEGLNTAVGGAAKVLNAVSPVVSIVAQIASIAGVFFAAITSVIDACAMAKSIQTKNSLKELLHETKSQNPGFKQYNPDVVNAVEYAIDQKYEKSGRRALAFSSGLASIGGGIIGLVLASNPIGWAIGAALAALGGLGAVGLLLYKIGHWFRKRRGGILGKKRNEIATLLYEKLRAGDALAEKALQKLGLPVEAMQQAKEGVLKSDKLEYDYRQAQMQAIKKYLNIKDIERLGLEAENMMEIYGDIYNQILEKKKDKKTAEKRNKEFTKSDKKMKKQSDRLENKQKKNKALEDKLKNHMVEQIARKLGSS